jgi:hypothetical protein
VNEVVGESLPNEMMLLQGPEGVLEDRIIGTGLQRLPQLG